MSASENEVPLRLKEQSIIISPNTKAQKVEVSKGFCKIQTPSRFNIAVNVLVLLVTISVTG